MVELGLVGFYIYRTRERGGLEIGFVCLIGWMLGEENEWDSELGLVQKTEVPLK